MFAEVHTFEPYAENYVQLAENCKERDNITCYLKALGAYVGAVDILHLEGGNSGMNITIPGEGVQAVTIDSLKLSSCGLIQLDIERHEMFALMGAIETIEKFKPVVILEEPETTNNVCNAILANMGYAFVGRAGVDSIFKYTGASGPFTQYPAPPMKKILIAIPTARYIEAETFKCIFDLEVPAGCTVQFQYFYGYRVDQVRNLIADWVVKDYDYLFAVDHDVTFPRDTLVRLLAHDKDLVAGIYRQRVEPQALEIFDLTQRRMDISELANRGLVEIGGCGFGCVLVKKQVLAGVRYPQFEYHPALDHGNAVSEDTDFCAKAMKRNFKLYCDTSILCGHIGSTTLHVKID